MAAYAVDTLQSPGSLKAFEITVTTPNEGHAKAIVEALNPMMYFVKSDFSLSKVSYNFSISVL